MDWQELNSLIAELESLMPTNGKGSWKTFWDKTHEIQKGFNDKVRFPPGEHAQAWERFNSLRDNAKKQREQQNAEFEGAISKLDEMIEEFRILVEHAFSLPLFESLSFRYVFGPFDLLGSRICDWRPVWEKAKEIQDIFNSGIRYPNKGQRDHAWAKFNNARNEASKHANAEREAMQNTSVAWRNQIIKEAESARYSRMRDLYSFMSTDADDMKKMGQWLSHAGEMLKINKHNMLKEHKDQCFETIQEVRATHQEFWGSYNEARERKHKEFLSRSEDALTRIGQNIADNEARKEKALQGLAHTEANIEKLEGMVASAYSDEFRDRFEGYLAEAEEKRQSIKETIARLDDWIATSEAKMSDIRSKLR